MCNWILNIDYDIPGMLIIRIYLKYFRSGKMNNFTIAYFLLLFDRSYLIENWPISLVIDKFFFFFF